MNTHVKSLAYIAAVAMSITLGTGPAFAACGSCDTHKHPKKEKTPACCMAAKKAGTDCHACADKAAEKPACCVAAAKAGKTCTHCAVKAAKEAEKPACCVAAAKAGTTCKACAAKEKKAH